MACFDNLIALKELCQGVTPVSGIYFNDIGVDLTLIESILTKEYSGSEAYIQAKQAIALKQIQLEVAAHFGPAIKTRTIIDNARVGYTYPNLVSVAGAANHRGLSFSVYNQANYLNLEIASIDLHVDVTASVDVLIYDTDQSKLLATIPVDGVAGQIVTVYPHTLLTSGKKYLNLFIGYDSTGINSYKTATHKGQCCGVYSLTNSYVKAQGVSVTGLFTDENFTALQDTAGVSVTYSLSCDSTSWMCAFAQLLALPLAYKTAAEVYRSALHIAPISRANSTTTVNQEIMNANWAWHEGKYREAMDSILRRMHLPKDSICFECDSYVRHQVILP
jgi:hypothetical protein